MSDEALERRVFALERAVQNHATKADMEALSAQIVQLGVEVRVGFSAMREEIRAGDEETRRVLRDEIRAGDEETRRVLRDEIRTGDEETHGFIEQRTADILAVVTAGDAETRRHAQMLHEEVIAQIRTIRNG